MAKNLLIVESPAKARTIEKFLGKDFTVRSSYGHIRDLEKEGMGIDIENNFKPKYIISPEKKKVVKELKDWVKKVDNVWLATDEDREGEAISWHLCEVLGLDEKTTKRIVFHEITKSALQNAIAEPRTVDINLVNAQQARRILDRLVGFSLSELLWRKIKGKLSAGRVQSVAVKLIVEREREINAFEAVPFFRVVAEFEVIDDAGVVKKFKAELPKRYDREEDARAFLEACKKATFTVGQVETKPFKKRPAPPFTTSTLQQEASRKMGFAVNRTMRTAQRLYEEGWITYMRTDSTNMSPTAVENMAAHIASQFGKQYVHTRQYATKKANVQEAHEAIRPTYIDRMQVSDDSDMQRLYELVWKRSIACQMADAEFERTKAQILISTRPKDNLEAQGEVLKFDGFLKVYLAAREDDEDEEQEGILPPLAEGQTLTLGKMDATESFTRPPARYTEALLVKKLEDLGIGRPSTYAPTITKIMEEGRGYVVKESRPGVERTLRSMTLSNGKITSTQKTENTGATSNRLYPTDMGMLVTDFLSQHFDEIMDYSFTAEIEKEFDIIAEGDLEWHKMISDFYGPFKKGLEHTKETAERAKGKRILGIDEKTGHSILVQMSRYGPVVQIGTKEEVGEEGKPRFASLNRGQSMESITLEDALELFKLPKTLGEYKGLEVSVATGRYGPYVKYGEAFISMPRGTDPLAVDLARAIELIDEKEVQDRPMGEYDGKPITKGKGRFGPYIKWDGIFINVPKKYDHDTLSLDDAHTLIAAKVKKEANRFVQKWEAEKISIENGRWGPFIRHKKKSIALPKINGQKITSEQAATLTLEEVKEIIKGEVPKSVVEKMG
ncbi:MAG TPA: type I DNA topoisomerase [Saprospiraceae bacterium]|nr:type I DNA topoisomerase [Saprospiraceae bacterium]